MSNNHPVVGLIQGVAMRAIKQVAGAMIGLVSVLAVAEPMNSPACQKGLAEYVAGDYVQAADVLAPLADAGDACAQHWLGMLYRDGNGVEMDKDAALALWQKAADQGYGPALVQVAASQD